MIFKTWLSDINKVAIAKDSLSGIRFDSKNASVVTAYTSAIKGLNEEQARYVLTKRYVSETDQADLLVKAQIISATEGVKASELSRQLVLQGLRKEQADALIEQISGNEAITSNTILTKEQTTAILEQAEARKLLSAEQRQNIANDIEESASSAAEATAEMAQASSELAESTAKVGTTSSILARGVSQLGTGMKSLLSIFVSSPIAIITTLTGSIVGLTYIIGKFQDSAKNAAKAASDFASSMSSINSTYNQETQTLNELTEKYKDLREQLIEAKGNEEETYSIKSQMLELQKQLNEIYGDEYDKVNLVTDAYRDQTDELKENAKQKAENYLNENVDKIEEATKKMTSDYDYELGNFNYGLQDASIGNELHDQIKKLAEKNGIEWDDNKGFVFKGTAEEASKAINQFMTDVRGLRESEDGLSDGIIDNLKAFDSSMSNQLDIANKIIDGYQETYETAQLAQIASDTNLSKGYNQAIDAVEKYNDAVLRSENPYDDENVKKAWDNLQTIKNGIKENEAEWGQYSNIMDDVFSAASDDAYSFYQTMQSDDSVSKLVDDLQGLSDTDLQSMADDGMEDSFDKLCQKANEYGLEVQDVIDLLLQLGIVQGKVQDSVPDKTDISSFSDAWDGASDDLKTKLKGLAEQGKLTKEIFEETDSKNYFSGLGISAEEATKKINALVDSSDQLSAMSSQISKMSNLLANKKNGTVASASDLSGFSVEVKGLDSWKEFEAVMGSSKSTMAQCQKAANDLATEWVNNGNFLSNLTDENKAYYETQLDQMGVANAQEIVENALAIARENEATQTEYATIATQHNSEAKSENEMVSTDLTNATASEIAQLLTEANVSEATKGKIVELWLAKVDLNSTKINTASDVEQIVAIANAAGASVGYVNALKKALNDLVDAQTPSHKPSDLSIDGFNTINDWKNESNKSDFEKFVDNMEKQKKQDKVDDLLSKLKQYIKGTQLKASDFQIKPTGSQPYKDKNKSKGKGSSSKKSKTEIDWIERKITILNNKIDAFATKANDTWSSWTSRANALNSEMETTKKLLTSVYGISSKTQKKLNSQRDSAKNKLDKYVKKNSKVLTSSTIKKIKSGKLDTSKLSKKDKKVIEEYKKLQKDYNKKASKAKKASEKNPAADYYFAKANKVAKKYKLSPAIIKKIKNGTINISDYNESMANAIQKYQDYYDKGKDAQKSKKETKQKLNELAQQNFELIQSKWDSRIGYQENRKNAVSDALNLAQSKGQLVGSAYYTKQKGINDKEISQYKKEEAELKKAMKDVPKYSEEWYNMKSKISEVHSKYVQLQADNAELQRSINELKFDRFDELINKFNDISDEANFLIDMLDSDNLFNSDNGSITNDGITAMGLTAQNYDVYLAKAEEYKNSIADLERMYKNGEIGISDYNSKMRELQEGYRDSIKSANDAKKAVIDYVKQGLDAQNQALEESINKQKELIEQKKKDSDFNKTITDQNKEIARLERQIAVTENDSSDENKKNLRELRSRLQELKDEQSETLYDRSVSDQEEALDQMLENSKKQTEDYLKDTDRVLIDAFGLVNTHTEQVSKNLEKISEDLGYDISTNITDAWKDGGKAVDTYANILQGSVPKINLQIESITTKWNEACKAAEKAAKASAKAAAGTDEITKDTDNNGTGNTSKTATAKEIKAYITDHADKAKQKKSYYGVLNRYLYEKTGGKVLSISEEVQLAKMLGVSVKKDLSGTGDRQKILDALKKKKIAFANGGVLGDLVKLTGEDGLFIGSAGESILTKEQTQALINFRPVIPQLNTMVDFMKNVPISRGATTSEPHIEINTTVEGVATDQIVKQMEGVAQRQAENVVRKINSATYAKGVRR